MPTVNVYLSETEYVKLANRALNMNVKATWLIRRAVQVWLKDQEK